MIDAGDNRNVQCEANYSEAGANNAPRGEAPSIDAATQKAVNTESVPPAGSDLISQARELLKDPAFMDEVMQLVKLRLALEKEFNSSAYKDIMPFLIGSLMERKR